MPLLSSQLWQSLFEGETNVSLSQNYKYKTALKFKILFEISQSSWESAFWMNENYKKYLEVLNVHYTFEYAGLETSVTSLEKAFCNESENQLSSACQTQCYLVFFTFIRRRYSIIPGEGNKSCHCHYWQGRGGGSKYSLVPIKIGVLFGRQISTVPQRSVVPCRRLTCIKIYTERCRGRQLTVEFY